jgi:hypothetical protein
MRRFEWRVCGHGLTTSKLFIHKVPFSTVYEIAQSVWGRKKEKLWQMKNQYLQDEGLALSPNICE